MAHRILVASYTNEIHSLSFDSSSLTLKAAPSTTVGFHPSWITAHPDDHSLVFACFEQDEGKVVALRYDEEGKGTVLSEASSAGGSPCSLYATKDELFVANYIPAVVSTFSISTQPPYIVPQPTSVTPLTGSGPNEDRQEASHAHQVVLHDGELFVPDLGSDRVHRFTKDAKGWKLVDHVTYPGGSGPRHIAFYDNHAYTLLELTSEISKHPHPAPGSSVTETKPTLSKPLPRPNKMLAAEILIPKPNSTFTTPYVYVSNRNDPSPEGDTISIFTTDLELVAEVHTGLKHLRGMLFGGPDEKWLVAGGAEGGGAKVFERIDGGKGLKEVAAEKSVQSPTGFLWL